MQNIRNTQSQLNLPFEFQEVLLSPRERARLQKALSSDQLFGGGESAVFTEFKMRELSIRLRTINNAHDTMFTLPDGTPVTEVSIYGSRDRQHLAAPYAAVKHLMKGDSPPGEEIRNAIARDSKTIAALQMTLATLKEQLAKESGIEQRIVETGSEGGRHPLQFQDWGSQLILALNSNLTGFREQLDAVLQKIDESSWWWPWTATYKEQASEIMGRYNIVMNFYTEVSKEMKPINMVHRQLKDVQEQIGIKGGVVRLILEEKQQQIEKSDHAVVQGFIGQLVGFSTELGALIPLAGISNDAVQLADLQAEIKGHAAKVMERYQAAMKTFLVDLYPEQIK